LEFAVLLTRYYVVGGLNSCLFIKKIMRNAVHDIMNV